MEGQEMNFRHLNKSILKFIDAFPRFPMATLNVEPCVRAKLAPGLNAVQFSDCSGRIFINMGLQLLEG